MKIFKKIGIIVRKLLLYFFLASVLSVLLFGYVQVPVTPLMITRVFEQWGSGKSMKITKSWVALDYMSGAMALAAICGEDGKFLAHHGFDIEAIQKAWRYNQKNQDKKPIKGGSTISQQVAKNVFLWQGRNFIRKGLEAYFTVLIELFWTKHRIMEVYLNVIEMGDGIYGAEAAAQAYFGKSCRQLNKGEAALIVVCFPNPRKYTPLQPDYLIFKKQKRLLRQMNLRGKIKWE